MLAHLKMYYSWSKLLNQWNFFIFLFRFLQFYRKAFMDFQSTVFEKSSKIWQQYPIRAKCRSRQIWRRWENVKMYSPKMYSGPTIPSLALPAVGRLWLSDDDDDIYIMMKHLSVCLSREMITSSWESPVTTWTPITTLSNSRLVLMVPDWFFMVPCRFL